MSLSPLIACYWPFLGGNFGVILNVFGVGSHVVFCILLFVISMLAVVDQLPRLGKRERES